VGRSTTRREIDPAEKGIGQMVLPTVKELLTRDPDDRAVAISG
jgi:hypothetical protein